MTKREINKNKIQDYAVYLSTKFKHVVLQWATGCGKSLAAIKIIDEDIRSSTEKTGSWNRWYIVVAERQHMLIYFVIRVYINIRIRRSI
jgi:superfamily II DNA or RNA helicase